MTGVESHGISEFHIKNEGEGGYPPSPRTISDGSFFYILFLIECYYSADAGFAAYEFPWEAADYKSLVENLVYISA